MTLAEATRSIIKTDMAGSGLPSETFITGMAGLTGTQQFAKDWLALATACLSANQSFDYATPGFRTVNPITIREEALILTVTVAPKVLTTNLQSVITGASADNENGYLGTTGINLTASPFLASSTFFQTTFTISPLQVLMDTAILMNTYDKSTETGYRQKLRVSVTETGARMVLEADTTTSLLPTYAQVVDFI
jgi:hypothetical protein